MKDTIYPDFPILLVDDEHAWLRSLRISLARMADINNVVTCDNSREVIKYLEQMDIGLILLDLTMPYLSGEEVLRFISEHYPEIKVIIVTGMNQVETAVRCMKQGAFDYLIKTSEEERIINTIKHAIRMIEMQRENREISRSFFSEALLAPEAFSDIITASPLMHSIFRYLEAVVKSSHPLLITGESGVGKGLIAQAVHKLSRCKGDFITVNVGGLDDTMFADTLFGHMKGAFTGADQARSGLIEKATGGTLFLDEIGDLSSLSQLKLLQLLQEGDYYPLGSDQPKRLKARIITSTHQNLESKLEKGQFRKDLYYRLKHHHVHVPALRERREDITALFYHFINVASKDISKLKPRVSHEILPMLNTYNFPGNVRELKAIIFDAIARCSGDILEPKHFALLNKKDLKPKADKMFSAIELFDSVNELPTISETLRLLIQTAMKRTKGNQSEAARLLGISQPALSKRLKHMQEDF